MDLVVPGQGVLLEETLETVLLGETENICWPGIPTDQKAGLYLLIITAHWRLRQEDREFETSLAIQGDFISQTNTQTKS